MKTEYKLDERPYKIATLHDENKKVTGFAVTDRNLERVDAKSFNTPAEAIEWADEHFEGLV